MRTFAYFLGLILLGLAAIAVFTYPAWLLLHPHFEFPFHRIGERIGMLALGLGFIVTARRLGLSDRTSLGYGLAPAEFLRQASIGLALGVVTMAAVVGLMTALGLLDWTAAAAVTAAALAKLVALRLVSGLAVAFIEETFYSATHFFASFRIPAAEVSSSSGVALLEGTLQSFAHPLGIADAFLCLVAVGILLGRVRVATGNIAACIGLHAGWVWVMLVVHAVAQPVRTSPLSFLLSRFDGFVGWLVLAWTIPLGFALQRFYAPGTGANGVSASSR
jgi:hypothetical protein